VDRLNKPQFYLKYALSFMLLPIPFIAFIDPCQYFSLAPNSIEITWKDYLVLPLSMLGILGVIWFSANLLWLKDRVLHRLSKRS
jgi:hypothetical protein